MEGDIRTIGVQGLVKVDDIGLRCKARVTRCAEVVACVADAKLQASFDRIRIGRVPDNVPTSDLGAHLEIVAVLHLEPVSYFYGIAAPAVGGNPLHGRSGRAFQRQS
jgi:hypothetical protein